MKKSCPGFTLIELLVTISIMGILFGLGVAKFNEFNRRQILDQSAQELKSNLRLAQDKALAGEKDCSSGILDGWEVNFGSNYYRFRSKCGPNYGSWITKNLPSLISISTSPSPNPILFKVLGKGTNITGSTNIILSGFSETRTITVTTTGEIK